MSTRKVIFAEINEITWSLINPMLEQGKLPTFARLRAQGSWGAPSSVDLPPQMDPWITWTTVYTGLPQSVHNVFFLQQDPATIKAKRIWEVLSERGVSVGVYGSVCSWPPQAVKGYCVPDAFSQDFATYPESLSPIQKLNLTYTRSVRLPQDQDTLGFKIQLGRDLISLGLRPATMLSIVRQLITERMNPRRRWERVLLQPQLNLDFFRQLYRKYRPQFATYHTNHVAHLMHTYWKAMNPEIFEPLETTGEEIETYGRAIEKGYRSADALLASLVEIMDEETVLVVCSSMGQQPFLSKLKSGKKIGQIQALPKLIELIGMSGRVRAVPMMSDQFNVYEEEPGVMDQVWRILAGAYVDVGGNHLPMFFQERQGNSIVVSLSHTDEFDDSTFISFPDAPGAPRLKYNDLVYFTGQVKSGCHHPDGVMMMYGKGIRKGVELNQCSNLDIAPTLYSLIGQAIPNGLHGRVLTEAFDGISEAVRLSAPAGIAS